MNFKIRRTTERPAKHYDVIPTDWPNEKAGVGEWVLSLHGIEPTEANAERVARAVSEAFGGKAQ